MCPGAVDKAAVEREEPWTSASAPSVGAGQRPAQEADASLDALYRTQSPRLLRALSRRLASRDDALDLLQEIFARVAGLAPSRSAQIERPEAYLTRIASNLLRDRATQNVRRSDKLHVQADEETLPGNDPLRLLESRDMLRRLEVAVLKMKPRTREIFMAHRVDGLSYAEIAERTGLSIKGVEKQMSKAIAHVDRLLNRR